MESKINASNVGDIANISSVNVGSNPTTESNNCDIVDCKTDDSTNQNSSSTNHDTVKQIDVDVEIKDSNESCSIEDANEIDNTGVSKTHASSLDHLPIEKMSINNKLQTEVVSADEKDVQSTMLYNNADISVPHEADPDFVNSASSPTSVELVHSNNIPCESSNGVLGSEMCDSQQTIEETGPLSNEQSDKSLADLLHADENATTSNVEHMSNQEVSEPMILPKQLNISNDCLQTSRISSKSIESSPSSFSLPCTSVSTSAQGICETANKKDEIGSIAVVDTKVGEDNDSTTSESPDMFSLVQTTVESSADSESDSSSEDSSSTSSEEKVIEHPKESERLRQRQKQGQTLSKGELALEDLPPIQELSISVPRDECEAIGRVFSIVNQLVVVESLPNTPALNLDTVLFRETGLPLGEIFDVFGPVKGPFYCVRFNKHDDIIEKGIEKGELIYCAPRTDYTRYVFTYRLMMSKGCDASWCDDVEVPEEYQDYSDDEAERASRRPTPKSNGITESGPRKRKHGYNTNKTNNNFTMGEPWYRARLDESRRSGSYRGAPSPQPRAAVFSPIFTSRPSTPGPFSARRPPPPFSTPITRPSSPAGGFSVTPPSAQRCSPFTSPPGPPPSPHGPRLTMYSPVPPPSSVTGLYSKPPPSYVPPFVPTVPGSFPPLGLRPPVSKPSFGSPNPFNVPLPPLPPMESVSSMFPIPPPPRIGCLPRPNSQPPPPWQPPPPRPPPFSRQSQYNLY